MAQVGFPAPALVGITLPVVLAVLAWWWLFLVLVPAGAKQPAAFRADRVKLVAMPKHSDRPIRSVGSSGRYRTPQDQLLIAVAMFLTWPLSSLSPNCS